MCVRPRQVAAGAGPYVFHSGGGQVLFQQNLDGGGRNVWMHGSLDTALMHGSLDTA
jgi:hypothetical protein